MEDAAGEISFLITLELREEDGKTILTVKPDRDWLSAENVSIRSGSIRHQ